jgi:hypothetical protein
MIFQVHVATTIQVGRGYGVARQRVDCPKASLQPGEIDHVHGAVVIQVAYIRTGCR